MSTILMPAVLSRVQRLAPDVRLEVLSNDFSHSLEILERADVDFVIMPDIYRHKSHPSTRLFDDDCVCILWRENTLERDSLSSELHFQLGHVSLQFGRSAAPMADTFIESQFAAARRVDVIAMNFNSLIQYVVGTARIATVHRRLAQYPAQRHLSGFWTHRLHSPHQSRPVLLQNRIAE